ncbi:MAG: sensor histidine kinase [Gemmatimonadales bacterium]|nr:sensor histidine kinase [Gemmatimonadales bacterium]
MIALVGFVLAWNQHRVAAEAKRWGRYLLAAQDEERHRIARELHDDVVPRIFAARLAVERTAAADAEAQLGKIAASIRTLSHDLHPPALEYLDLRQALGDLLARHHSGVGPTVELAALEDVSVPGDAALALYRVAQEGLMNALKHASASHIHLLLERDSSAVRLVVLDDGTGMPAQSRAKASFGLRSMRERLGAVGGSLEIDSAIPNGTRLTAKVPLR